MEKQETDASPIKISRRDFLKIITAGGAGLVAWWFSGGRINVFESQKQAESEDIFTRLIRKIYSSDLQEKGEEFVSKERLLTFVERVKAAGAYFEEMHKNERKIQEILDLTRNLYSNPDILPEKQVFFLRDEWILGDSLLKMDSLDFGIKREELEKETLQILTEASTKHSKKDDVVDPVKWPTTPENLSKIYALAGRRKNEASLIPVHQPERPIERVGQSEINNLSRISVEAVKQVGVLPGTEVYILEVSRGFNKPTVHGSVKEDYVNAKIGIELNILTDDKPPAYEELIKHVAYHEAGHALDVLRRIDVVQYLSTSQLLDLYTLRLRAAIDTDYPNVAQVISPRYISGHEIKGEKIDNISYRDWVIRNISSIDLEEVDWKSLSHIYFRNLWYMALAIGGYFSEPVTRLSAIQREMYKSKANQQSYTSWQEFLKGEKEIFRQLSERQNKEEKIMEFTAKKIKDFVGVDKNLQGKEGAYWWSVFWSRAIQIIGEDLIKKGEVKDYVSKEIYQNWLRRITIEFQEGLSEKFADEVAFYLSFEGTGKTPEWLDKLPAVIYHKKIREVLPSNEKKSVTKNPKKN